MLACLLAVGALALACGGSGSAKKDDGTGLRFLLGSQQGLSEVTASTQKLLLHFDDGSYVLDPAISRDGKMIAFIRQRPATTTPNGVDFGSDLYVANRDGSGVNELVHHGLPGETVETPVWLPSGKDIVYDVRGLTPGGGTDIRIEQVNLANNQRQRLIQDAVDPALSPDGKTLAYVGVEPDTQAERPMLYDLAGAQSTPVAGYDKNLAFLGALTWSPDGKVLAFAAADPSVPTGVAKSTGPAYVSYNPSAPGGTIAPRLHPFLQDVWLIDVEGTNGLRRLSELAESQPSLSWSPDGTIVYAMGSSGLWQIDVASGMRQQIGAGVAQGSIVLLNGP